VVEKRLRLLEETSLLLHLLSLSSNLLPRPNLSSNLLLSKHNHSSSNPLSKHNHSSSNPLSNLLLSNPPLLSSLSSSLSSQNRLPNLLVVLKEGSNNYGQNGHRKKQQSSKHNHSKT
jgi:hypothetical protein